MAKIPLRAYITEIENLIDRGQTEEAIGHCRYLLLTYPKYLEVYRLLGKAYLESRRYGEAADIFLRIIASIPDDFVSHIGLSIIREDEGNLDSAIWHMERAFEAQPANPAVQEELRRLYGRRDGIEPQRIRLTRGALVRAYARGDLYQQAIAEIRTALIEDPNRFDLQVILAKMYHLSGQKVKATEICSSLLAKYPYCYEANRILADILPSTTRAEDAKIYQQRVVALDPYAAYLTEEQSSTTDVPENAIQVERYLWQPGLMPERVQPDWAESLGIEMEQPKTEEAIPSWLDVQSPLTAQEPDSPFTIPVEEATMPAPVSTEEPIPDWMQEIGWQPSTPEAVQATELAAAKELEDQTLTSAEGELAPAQLPEWLKDLQPEEPAQPEQSPAETEQFAAIFNAIPTEEPAPSSELPGEEPLPAWLQDLGEEPAPQPRSSIPTEEPTPIEDVTAVTEELPEWLAALEPAEVQTDLTAFPAQTIDEIEELPPAQPAEDIPSWLQDLAAESGSSITEQSTQESQAIIAKSAQEQLVEASPSWQMEIEQVVEAPLESIETPITHEEELPDWLAEIETTPPVLEDTQPTAVAASLPVEESSEDWLKELEPEQETQLSSQPPSQEIAIQEEEIPAWLDELQGAQLQPSTSTEIPAQPPVDEQLPDWLKEMQAESDALITESELTKQLPDQTPSEVQPSPSEEIPDWLKELQKEDGRALTESVEEPEVPALVSPQEEDLPTWLSELEPQVPEEQLSQIDKPVLSLTPEATQQPAEAPMPDLSNPEDAFAWLEALAAKQGAAEEELLTTPSERLEELPHQSQVEAAEGTGESIMSPHAQISQTESIESAQPALKTEQPPADDADAALAWLETLAARQGAASEELITVPDQRPEEPPAWVQEVSTQAQETSTWISEVPEVEPIETSPLETHPNESIPAAKPLPDWLTMEEDIALSSEQAQPAQPEEEVLPPWLSQLEESPQVEQEAEQLATQAESQIELPSWISSLEQTPVVEDTTEAMLAAEEHVPPAEETLTEPLMFSTETEPLTTERSATPTLDKRLEKARADLDNGKIDAALEIYNALIASGEQLEEITRDLEAATYRYLMNVDIWQSLGDTYARADRIQEALEAYTKAEELLR